MSDHETSVPVPEDEQHMRRRVVYLLDNDINGEPMSLARDMLTLLDRLTALREEKASISEEAWKSVAALERLSGKAARLTRENQRARNDLIALVDLCRSAAKSLTSVSQLEGTNWALRGQRRGLRQAAAWAEAVVDGKEPDLHVVVPHD